MGGGGYPVGRYVLALDGAQKEKVALVSDALANVEPKPDNWLNKDFFKIEKLRAISIAAVIETNNWKLTRETETGDWTLADKKEGEELDKGKSSSVSYALSSPSFNDVVSPASKPEETGMDKPVVASLETFDNFVYTVKIGKKTKEIHDRVVRALKKADVSVEPLGPDARSAKGDAHALEAVPEQATA
jgi:hypothetical protein